MDFEATYQQGGFIEFQRTGVYPTYLLFTSKKLKRNWRFKITGESQSGVLKIDKKIAFRYEFVKDKSCKIQSVLEDTNKWYEIATIIYEMRD